MSEHKTNGKRNKSAGSSWERDIVNKLKTIGFPFVGTTRNNSRSRDAQKIDIMNIDEGKHGRLEYNIQAKTLSKPAPYGKLLEELPQDGPEINVIFHKQTKKSEGGRFMTRGHYAILSLVDFYSMMQRIKKLEMAYKILSDHFDSIPDEFKSEVHGKLSSLGL